MTGKYVEFFRNNIDEDVIVSEDREYFKSLTSLFLTNIISYEQYKNELYARLTMINLEYNGYNIKELNDDDANKVLNLIIESFTQNDGNELEKAFKAAFYMIHLQLFDDANHRTGYRLLDMLLYYHGYELDIKEVFKQNKESSYIIYSIPIIYDDLAKIDIPSEWYNVIKKCDKNKRVK